MNINVIRLYTYIRFPTAKICIHDNLRPCNVFIVKSLKRVWRTINRGKNTPFSKLIVQSIYDVNRFMTSIDL